ncbi:MAG: C69 family dipeptidase [Bacteroidaceae bacterium]|nr:C69 family dipeptidase [Bacteroidaceae bacterium]
MKRNILLIICLSALQLAAQEGLEDSERLSCTSIAVGRLASTDGSVITSHTCDSWYRTWMQWVPAADYPRDTIMSIYNGRLHTENPLSMQGVTVKGEIPQVAHTYRFLDTAYPCLNEKRLGIGETTISGRKELRNKDGMFVIEELQRVVLQRCTSAREAIRLMGELIKKYGYGDGGECLTIADTAEVWLFEVFGEGPKHVGGVWAAQRIPDDEVAVSANVCRIGQIDTADSDRFMASDNVRSVAKKLGLWDGKEEFSFWKAYSGGNYVDEPKNFSIREWFVLNTLAPSLHLSMDAEELPVSVRPDHKVSVEDVSHLLGSYYEGTQYDYTQHLKVPNTKKITVGDSIPEMIVSPVANPWMRSDEQALFAAKGDSTFQTWIRFIGVPQCAYSTVIQLFGNSDDTLGGIVWMALDNPGESPRFPIYTGSTQLPKMCEICGNHSYRDDCALWHFRRTNKLATVRWGTCRKTLEPAREHYLLKGLQEKTFVAENVNRICRESDDDEQVHQFLNDYTADFLGAAIFRWDELYRTYWRQFWSGF